jgi:hypothetical protein
MNTNDLAKHYDQLTARERLPLILAASARADAVERQRLLDSAPRVRFEAPHHFRLADALFEAAHFHLITLLDLAATYWQWWGLWGWHCLRDETEKDNSGGRGKRAAAAARTKEARIYNLTRYHAFLFVTHVDGWKQFCAELSIDAAALRNDMPGWRTVTRTEGAARELAFARDDAMMFMLSEAIDEQGVEAEDLHVAPVPTAAGLAREWHAIRTAERVTVRVNDQR